jgi:excisionase family DNA binding protein
MVNQLISIREASKEADVSIGYINQLIKAGVLSAQKVGQQWVIDRASFEAWQQKRKKQGEG